MTKRELELNKLLANLYDISKDYQAGLIDKKDWDKEYSQFKAKVISMGLTDEEKMFVIDGIRHIWGLIYKDAKEKVKKIKIEVV